jgi:hypothetical protein
VGGQSQEANYNILCNETIGSYISAAPTRGFNLNSVTIYSIKDKKNRIQLIGIDIPRGLSAALEVAKINLNTTINSRILDSSFWFLCRS